MSYEKRCEILVSAKEKSKNYYKKKIKDLNKMIDNLQTHQQYHDFQKLQQDFETISLENQTRAQET